MMVRATGGLPSFASSRSATRGSGCSPGAPGGGGRTQLAAEHNYGIAQARGEYVARQDFEDRTYPERLRLQVALLDGRPEVGMVGGYYLLVNERRGERYVPMHLLDLDAYCAGVSLGRGRDI
jgi:hypothetical protein